MQAIVNKLLPVVPMILIGLMPVFATEPAGPTSPSTWVSYLTGPESVHCPIVFIHGISAGFEKWEETAQFISSGNVYKMRYSDKDHITHNYVGPPPPVWVWNVSYYSPDIVYESLAGDLTLYAHRLDKLLATISKITGQDQFVLVAHSMGGLVTRKMVTLNPENSRKVIAILTVGTPHEGVPVSIPVVGQLRDLMTRSDFLKTLDRDWRGTAAQCPIRWGVIGGIATSNIHPKVGKNTTDFGGPGFVAIHSSIPFGEWQDAIKTIDTPTFNTAHFGFRAAITGSHNELLNSSITRQGIFWAVSAGSSLNRHQN